MTGLQEASMLSKEMVAIISEQIKKEYESAYMYLEISDYYQNLGLNGFVNWFFIQAREEVDHAMIFYEYLHSNSAQVQFYEIKPTFRKYGDVSEPLEESLIHEEYVTDSINKIYELAEKEKDFRTKQFLSWFITEQQEEEENARKIIEKMKLFGSSAAGLYELDHEFNKRFYSVPAVLKNK